MIPITELRDALVGPCTVFYHAGCMDGFASAWAAWKRLGTQNTTFIPFRPHQKVLEREVHKRHVIFTDVAPDRSQLSEMERMQLSSLRILDHHDTSRKDWEDTPFMVFSSTKSGAWLAWDFFHPDFQVPRFITYVSDRDTWQRSLPRVDDLMALLWMTPFHTKHGVLDFEVWDDLVRDVDTEEGFETQCRRGARIRKVMDRHISISSSKAFPCLIHNVWMWTLNDPTPHRSMVADILLRKPLPGGDMPGAVMVWYFHAPTNSFACSLRSRADSDVDVGTIAEHFGGGGRKNTAAFMWANDIRQLVTSS